MSRQHWIDLPDGVRHAQADLTQPETLRGVLEGADALLILLAGGVDVAPSDLLDVVKASGLRRVVLLSSQGAGIRPENPSHAPLAAFERPFGIPIWRTVLRPGGFHSNALVWAKSIRRDRTAAAPFGEIALPWVDPADIADVAAEVLRSEQHTGRTYLLTGPHAITPQDRAAVIGDALGAPVRFVEQSREQARAQMLQFMPEPVIDCTLDILGKPLPAELQVSPDVERVLGRAPRSFADWATRNVAFR